MISAEKSILGVMFTRPVMRVIFISAHLDDAEAAAGGTIIRLLDEGDEIIYVGLSLCEESIPTGFEPDVLASECTASTKILGISEKKLIIKNFPVRRFPDHRQEILDEFIRLRNDIQPDVVVIPSSSDIHQDHAVVTQEAVRAFRRSCSVYGYDFPWNVLQTSPLDFFVELKESQLMTKVRALQCYKSQLAKPNSCLTKDYVRSLAIERGNRIGKQYAEAFEVMREVRSSDGRIF